ncbi:uncharacterized protein B0H64DRAFT_441098 [Chaetomium fimeti]|uniref:Protein kinase domain-containing protein n=1 Tax=Chaetomium fimeti TaxID=1854472 RepID=A0AAE0HJD2_9PEZI|nr:hypothetical protein B0H64DRAFT_441098 [Chaetomium fimeti]
MEGSLADLNVDHPLIYPPRIADEVLPQMLPALAYLSGLGTTTSTTHPQTYHFRLGDFGLCEHTTLIPTDGSLHRTWSYLAPELLPTTTPATTPSNDDQQHHRRQNQHQQQQQQTQRSDVWARCVTVLWTLDPDGVWGVAGLGGWEVWVDGGGE